MRHIYLTTLLACVLSPSFAQNGWTASSVEEFSQVIMEIEQSVPQNSSYSYETEYKFYEELESTTSVMTEKALLICLQGKEIYMKQFGRTIVQNEQLNVICDTVSSVIILNTANPDFTKRKTATDFSPLDVSGTTVLKKTAGGKNLYYLQFPNGFHYAGIELTLGGPIGVETYILYSQQTTFENTQGSTVTAQPRVEVRYKNYLQGTQVTATGMKRVADFVTLQNGEYVLNANYQQYELIDLRSENH